MRIKSTVLHFFHFLHIEEQGIEEYW